MDIGVGIMSKTLKLYGVECEILGRDDLRLVVADSRRKAVEDVMKGFDPSFVDEGLVSCHVVFSKTIEEGEIYAVARPRRIYENWCECE